MDLIYHQNFIEQIGEDFFCHLCTTTLDRSPKTHMESKGHQKKCRMLMDMNSNHLQELPEQLAFCHLCDKKFPVLLSKEHIDGAPHKRNAFDLLALDKLSKNENGLISCGICNLDKINNDPKTIQEHVNGKKHYENKQKSKAKSKPSLKANHPGQVKSTKTQSSTISSPDPESTPEISINLQL